MLVEIYKLRLMLSKSLSLRCHACGMMMIERTKRATYIRSWKVQHESAASSEWLESISVLKMKIER